MLLDQEGFECDPISRIEGDTPLHSAIRYINTLTDSQPSNPDISTFAQELISMMIEAGSDPRLRNKANLTPYQLTDPRNTALKQQLQDAVDIMQNQGDFIVDGEEGGEEGEEDDYAGSASDSDFDPEEYKREKDRREKEKKALVNGVGSS
jgi:ankyrin repeat protein